jgi:hypothetical protein
LSVEALVAPSHGLVADFRIKLHTPVIARLAARCWLVSDANVRGWFVGRVSALCGACFWWRFPGFANVAEGSGGCPGKRLLCQRAGAARCAPTPIPSTINEPGPFVARSAHGGLYRAEARPAHCASSRGSGCRLRACAASHVRESVGSEME